MVCENCGAELSVGDWPYCPHGRTGNFTNFRDEIPGGVVVENYGPDLIRFDSHSERRRYMKAHDLNEKEKFCPMPGTDKDPQGIPNPKGYMDPQTLENARLLISRNGQKTADDDITGILGDTYSGSMTSWDAIALTTGDAARQSRLHRRTSGTH